MSRFFNIDNPVWVFIGKFADVFILNLIWFICCIPIVTIGASTTALYYVTLKLAKNEEGYIVRGFFKSFKENFKQATAIWLIMLAVGIVLGVDYYFYLQVTGKGTLTTVLYMLFFGFLFIYIMVLSYVFPVLSRFVNSVKNTLKNSLFIAIRHLPWSILMVIVAVAVVIAVFLFPPVIFLGFGLIAFIQSYILVRVFKNYMPKEQEEDMYAVIAALDEERANKEQEEQP